MGKQGLSPERQRRLEELRKKYPKQEPPKPEPECYDACVEVTLRFEFRTHTQEEADRAAYDWLWNKGHDITDLLYDRYAKDGLRDITLSQEERTRQTEPTEEPATNDDLYPLDIEDVRESDLSN